MHNGRLSLALMLFRHSFQYGWLNGFRKHSRIYPFIEPIRALREYKEAETWQMKPDGRSEILGRDEESRSANEKGHWMQGSHLSLAPFSISFFTARETRKHASTGND